MPDPTTGESTEGKPVAPPSSPRPAITPGDLSAAGPGGQENKAADGERAAAPASMAGQARQRLAGALDTQKGAAADKVEQFAQTVQRSAEQFEGRQDWIASAIGRGAEELNTLAGSLRQKDLGDLLGQVQAFAQRQPTLFAGAAFAAGFALARVGKLVAGDLSRDDLPTLPEVGHGQH